MKLGLVRRGFSASGGAEAYLQRFASALAAAGHEPLLFSGVPWPQEAWPWEQRLVRGRRSPAEFALTLAETEPRQACDFLLSLERVLACDCYRAGDGVHAAWLERRSGAEPFWKPLLRQWQPRHQQILALERAMFAEGTARQVIANSRMVREEIVAHYGYPAERIHVVYNGAPPGPEEETRQRLRAETRAELGLAESRYVVLFAGSGWARKGLRCALEAINRARLPDALLLVAGRGRPGAMPRSDRVHYLGAVPGLTRWLAAADAFILPTLYDPFSNACLEAAAAGLPVITTRANGFAEIITPEEGTAFQEPQDVSAAAEALEQWADPRLRATARTLLREKTAAFTVERNLRDTLALVTLAK